MDLTGKTINECYKIIKKVGDNSICDVYKAEGVFSPLEFALKIFKKPNDEYKIEDIIRFKKDMMSIYRIYHPNITKVFEIDTLDEHTYVTMEFTYGMSLSEYLGKGYKLTFEEILQIIQDISSGLEVAHRNGSLHKNLNLQNIILSIDEGRIKSAKITNFGFGEIFLSYAGKENINNLLLYMPPEICNVCNKKYDNRSDLFSLGIIFYYLLTGKYPFYGENIENYFKSIATVIPGLPSKNSDYTVPAVLDKLILKLLSISKNERYQSALGVLTDIERIKRNELLFELGIEDTSFTTVFQTDLIDREKEITELAGFYENAKKNFGSGILITGGYGIGKTRISEELGRHVIKSGGIYLKTNCINNVLPYNAFRKILCNFFYYLTTLDEKKRDAILSKIKEIDAELDNILSWFINSLNIDIKEYAGINNAIKTAPEDIKGKMAELFCRLSALDPPLVISITNIQFADPDSLELIGRMLEKINDQPLMLILTCSDSQEKPEKLLLDIINGKTRKLNLKEINSDDVKSLLHDILKDRDNKITDSISEYISKTSSGEPYLILEALRQLINDGVVYPDIDRWDIDLKKFNQKTGEAGDVILKKLQLLRSNELNILTLACLIDGEFDLDLIFKINKTEKEDVITVIDDLINEDFLKVYSNFQNTYIYADYITKTALTGKLEKNRKIEIYNEIAQVFEASIGENQYNLFSAAHHYLKAENLNKAVECSIKAGLKAKAAGAKKTAFSFFNKGLEMIEKNGKTLTNEYDEIKKYLEDLN